MEHIKEFVDSLKLRFRIGDFKGMQNQHNIEVRALASYEVDTDIVDYEKGGYVKDKKFFELGTDQVIDTYSIVNSDIDSLLDHLARMSSYNLLELVRIEIENRIKEELKKRYKEEVLNRMKVAIERDNYLHWN